MPETVSQLVAALRQRIDLHTGERLYGIVDAAQDADLALDAHRRFGVPTRTLFKGDAAQYMTEVAPHLVSIEPDSGYLESWAERWDKNVGILLTSATSPDKLVRHLRDIFVVRDEGGQDFFFRYYDPRVLRTFLPTCASKEALEFFGPVRLFLCEAASPGGLLVFSIAGSRVHAETFSLISAAR